MKPNKKELYKHIEKLGSQYKDTIPKYSPTIGFAIFLRTYSHWLKNKNQHETFVEMIVRCLKGCINLGTPYTKDELTKLFKYLMDRKCDLSGREKWALGSKLTEEGFADSLINCWGAVIDNYEVICTIFNQLMLGGGYGANIQNKYVSKLPVVKKVNKVEHYSMLHLLPADEWQQFKETGILIESSDKKAVNYLIADSREGWIELLRQVLLCYFETGQNLFYDSCLVRKRGEIIAGFGGKASGVEPLLVAIEKICEILNNAVGRQLSSVEVMDIICIIGQCVVSGNVRRTALIAIGDCDDIEFITSKRWDLHEVPDYRAMINISVDCDDIGKLPKEYWESYTELGESIGLCNLENFQTFGRTGKNGLEDKAEFYPQHFNLSEYLGENGEKYLKELKIDPEVVVINPCSEIGMESRNCCNLAQINLVKVENYTELVDILILLYKQKKQITQSKYLDSDVQNITNRSSRIGISVTSLLQCVDKWKWLSPAYREVRDFDVHYSLEHNFPIASKLTTIQPAGTGSTMDGVLNGIHAFYFKFGFKLMRVSSLDPIWKVAIKNGYRVENLRTKTGADINGNDLFTEDSGTKVIYYPMKAPDNAIISDDLSAIQHLNYVKLLQQEWVDNSISATVGYKLEELPEIKQWLTDNWKDMKTISFLQKKVESFLQMPYTECTETEYDEYMARVKPILNLDDFKDLEDLELAESLECSNGACPIR